jgi:hypothetical protein
MRALIDQLGRGRSQVGTSEDSGFPWLRPGVSKRCREENSQDSNEDDRCSKPNKNRLYWSDIRSSPTETIRPLWRILNWKWSSSEFFPKLQKKHLCSSWWRQQLVSGQNWQQIHKKNCFLNSQSHFLQNGRLAGLWMNNGRFAGNPRGNISIARDQGCKFVWHPDLRLSPCLPVVALKIWSPASAVYRWTEYLVKIHCR